MATPTVSIGLPVHNGEAYLEEAIASILGQSFDDFELIISDNASSDRTRAICRSFAQRDERIRYERTEQNRGAAWNYRRVFESSRGRYFKWAAHDDVCEPEFLEVCVRTLDAAPSTTVLAYPRACFIDARGEFIRNDTDSHETRAASPAGRLAHAIRSVNLANAVFGLIRSDVLSETRLIAPFIASDYVLLIELSVLGQIVEVPQVLMKRRLHPGSSRAANENLEDVARWFDPSNASVPRSVRLMLLREYYRSVSDLSLHTRDRLACYATIPSVYMYRRVRTLAGRLRRTLVDPTSTRRM